MCRNRAKLVRCGTVGAVRRALHPAGPRLIAAFAVITAALVAGSLGRAGPGPGLGQQAASLRAEERQTLLELYGLDSRLERVRSKLTVIRGRLGELARQQAAARTQLRVARRTLRVSERRLGRTLVALYETDDNDPLTVIFGATSFSEAVDGLDNLSQVASSHADIAAEARAARRRIASVSRSLRARAADARRLEAAAEANAAELGQARAERSAYLAHVRAESTALAERIAAVEAQARAAQARAETVATQAATASSVAAFAAAPRPEPEPAPAPEPQPAPPAPAPPPEEPAPVQAPASGARTLVVTATAYSMKGATSTGIPIGYGVVAVDPTVIPLGTRMTIPGYGEGVAADTGPGVQGAMIDVWLPTPAEAEAWGTKTLTITLH
jgi:3D (Asp-Asp-Asp) domain-containing protein/peptidoglycan hydrolase CwlO-like protein